MGNRIETSSQGICPNFLDANPGTRTSARSSTLLPVTHQVALSWRGSSLFFGGRTRNLINSMYWASGGWNLKANSSCCCDRKYIQEVCTYLMVLVLSYSSKLTVLWNSTASSLIHSSVTTGMISCRPTISLPCLHMSFKPSSMPGIPVRLRECNGYPNYRNKNLPDKKAKKNSLTLAICFLTNPS